MSMSDHIKHQMVQERSHPSEKRQNWIVLFYQNGRSNRHIKNMLH